MTDTTPTDAPAAEATTETTAIPEAASIMAAPVALDVAADAGEAPQPPAMEAAADAAPELTADAAPELAPDAGAEAHSPEAEAPAEPEAPRTVFADLGLGEKLLKAVAESGYTHPTPIQEQAIPIVLMGRDVLGCAQTGTGKTASFTLPMMDILAGSRAKARMPRSLILEPTRELALQVAEQFVKYGKYLGLTHALLIGGESMEEQKAALEKGVDVLVATPGRLLDLFDRGRILMADVKILVIDEADRMLDMGFIPDVERIGSIIPQIRQTLFFSATMAPEIRRLADAFLSNPKEITVSRPASVATTITAGLLYVNEMDKREALRRLIRREDVQNALIFCNRKRDVDILYKSLKKHGFSVGALHGDMDQSSRFATLNAFKANEIRLLVCSDVAARGLDIGGLSHVFNFDVPFHSEDYVHRIGRTGRAGREGHAYTLATPEDGKLVQGVEKLTGAPIPRMTLDGVESVSEEEIAEAGTRRRGGRGARPEGTRPSAGRSGGRGERSGGRERGERPRRGAAEEGRRGAADEGRRGAAEAAPRADEGEERPRRAGGDEPRRERMAEDRPRRGAADEGRRGAADEGRRGAADEGRRGAAEDGRRGAGEESRRGAAEEPRRAADDRPRDRDRRDDRRRDRDDMGPSVRGFGDDVPAFMLIPIPRPKRRAEGAEAPAMEQDGPAEAA